MPSPQIQLRPVTDFMVNELIPFYYSFDQRVFHKEEYIQLIRSICDQFLELPLSSTAYEIHPFLPLTKQGKACIAPCDQKNIDLFKLVFSIEYAIYLYVISESMPYRERSPSTTFETWKYEQFQDALSIAGRWTEFQCFLEDILNDHPAGRLYVFLQPSHLPDTDHTHVVDRYSSYSLKAFITCRLKYGMHGDQKKFNKSVFNDMGGNSLGTNDALIRNKFTIDLLDNIACSHGTAQKLHEEFKKNLQLFAQRNAVALKGVSGYWGMDKFLRSTGRSIYWFFGSTFYYNYSALIAKYWQEIIAFEKKRLCNSQNIISTEATSLRIERVIRFNQEAKSFCKGKNRAVNFNANEFNSTSFW